MIFKKNLNWTITKIRQISGRNMLKNIIFLKIYSYIMNLKLSYRKVIWIDEIQENRILLKRKEKVSIKFPTFFGNCEKYSYEEIPDIFIYIFNNVYSSVGSSSFYNKKYVFIERMNKVPVSIGNYATGHLFKHNIKKAVVQIYNEKTNIDSTALYLGGNGSFNYYHWIIEILPKLILLDSKFFKELNIQTIIVDKKVAEIKSFHDSLRIILAYKNINHKIIYIDYNKEIFFRKIIYITSFNCTLYNQIQINNVEYYIKAYYSKDILNIFRETILNSKNFINFLNNTKDYDKFPKRFFILRGKVSGFNKREYNEEEIFSCFEKYNFKKIFIEEYTFIEQVYLFNNASFIAAPSGAFLANMIFSKINTNIISWLPSRFLSVSCYSTIAHLYNLNMFFIEATPKDEYFHGPYTLNPDNVKNILLKLEL
ncbi:glycosyltransferase family 61 protein [Aliarcobacter skirrowii]|uniref:glycosyltransferase family 61 protein n=1 Tax=Aliarcobacter skirrowii TaxID=28200 RepID=UPI000F665CB0|nr:glycosyltransferase 61 family protein [Aliarcobacter skirrowii]AZL54730.1 glycosyltransferase family 61 protein [Aliarcobacter skirrowii]